MSCLLVVRVFFWKACNTYTASFSRARWMTRYVPVSSHTRSSSTPLPAVAMGLKLLGCLPQLGSHLGFDFGKITQVDAAGVHLREIYRDAEQYYRERLTVLDWDGRRRRTELPLEGVEK